MIQISKIHDESVRRALLRQKIRRHNEGTINAEVLKETLMELRKRRELFEARVQRRDVGVTTSRS